MKFLGSRPTHKNINLVKADDPTVHTQNTDQYLDFGGANQVAVGDVKDAVAKKHEHANKTELDTYSATTQNLEYWVDGTNGSDDNDGSQEHPFATINKALGLIPQVVNHIVDIYILDGTYAETIEITGKLGNGDIYIRGMRATTGVKVTNITGYQNICALYFSTLEVLSTDYDSVYFENNPGMLYFYAVNSTQTSSYGGFCFRFCPSVELLFCTISNRYDAILSTRSFVIAYYCYGSGNYIVFNVDSGIIFCAESSITGTTTESVYAGGQILSTQLANRDEEAVEGNLAKFDSSGNPVDSGIASNTVPDKTTANLTFYVNPSTGDDNNNGSSGSPFKTIAKAVSLIPQIVNHNVTINLADGSYSEGITLNGYVGSGSIVVTGNTSTPANVELASAIKATNCSCSIKIQGMETTITNTNAVQVDNSTGVTLHYIVAEGTTETYVGISATHALVYTRYCTVSNKLYGIYANLCSAVFSRDNGGTGNGTGLCASGGATIGKYNTQPGGTTAEFIYAGGEIR